MDKKLFFKEYVNWIYYEDVGNGDITSNLLIPASKQSKASIYLKQDGVISGLEFIPKFLDACNIDIEFLPNYKDGHILKKGTIVAQLKGQTRKILSIERVILNFLKKLSGIATLTRKYIDKVKKYDAKIFDTRKTTPGLRFLEKKAVKDGGGNNHRMGLYDMVLIKENHLTANKEKKIKDIIIDIRNKIPKNIKIELEVHTIDLLKEALKTPVDVIMLDNFTPEELKIVVALARNYNKDILLEASGNISLSNVVKYAKTGVDIISIGEITHSASAVDFSLLID